MQSATLVSRILIGIFFVVSGTANYYHFDDKDGFYATVLGSKLKLWGLGFEGVGPLPGPLAALYAYALPALEILLGLLFALGIRTRLVAGLLSLLLASFVLAFGFFSDSLLPNGEASFHKDVIFILAIWMIAAYRREA